MVDDGPRIRAKATYAADKHLPVKWQLVGKKHSGFLSGGVYLKRTILREFFQDFLRVVHRLIPF
ncbi:MAG: hypothetical protein A3C84_04275 [Candidatus Ryanbacteria bacterium RIFCSPHIGHO2_02_FULL_48_12]|nr:MAG: hypothetical protein A3C84_04275 [Candidatus Ryanbacteria bacterium RIFCSPHIGHO2_02_FULL_48_12]